MISLIVGLWALMAGLIQAVLDDHDLELVAAKGDLMQDGSGRVDRTATARKLGKHLQQRHFSQNGSWADYVAKGVPDATLCKEYYGEATDGLKRMVGGLKNMIDAYMPAGWRLGSLKAKRPYVDYSNGTPGGDIVHRTVTLRLAVKGPDAVRAVVADPKIERAQTVLRNLEADLKDTADRTPELADYLMPVRNILTASGTQLKELTAPEPEDGDEDDEGAGE